MKEAQVAEIWRLAYKLWLVVVLSICRGMDSLNSPLCYSIFFFHVLVPLKPNTHYLNIADFMAVQ